MPVNRCLKCKRGYAGYLNGEKTIHELRPDEISTEIEKYTAKEDRIRLYIENLDNGAIVPLVYRDGDECPECKHGWREFQDHRKDLEQLTKVEAIAALAANTRWLDGLKSNQSV
jgi:hypothetical protein